MGKPLDYICILIREFGFADESLVAIKGKKRKKVRNEREREEEEEKKDGEEAAVQNDNKCEIKSDCLFYWRGLARASNNPDYLNIIL